MSAASELRLQGFSALVDSETGSGESCSFRGASVDMVVRYEPREDPVPDKTNHFKNRGRSTIEILKTAIPSAPRVGEIITGPDARTHRIERLVRTTDLSYFVECVVSSPAVES